MTTSHNVGPVWKRDPKQTKRNILAVLLCVLVGNIFWQPDHRAGVAEEYRRADRGLPAELYYLATGELFGLKAACPTMSGDAGKPTVDVMNKPMRYVEFRAADRTEAGKFVTERYAGCRYFMVEEPVNLWRLALFG